jgi:hypothetical protein
MEPATLPSTAPKRRVSADWHAGRSTMSEAIMQRFIHTRHDGVAGFVIPFMMLPPNSSMR